MIGTKGGSISIELTVGGKKLTVFIKGRYEDGAFHVSNSHIRNMGLPLEEQNAILKAIKKDGRVFLDD